MTLTYWPVGIETSSTLSRWDSFVRDCPGSTIYHTSAWLDVLGRTYGFSPRLLTIANASGALSGVLPLYLVDSRITGRRLVSLPFTNVAGPLCLPGTDATPLLVAALDIAQREGCRYVEIRAQPQEQIVENLVMQCHNYFSTFVVDLGGDVDLTRSRFDKRARRGIAKASKSGVQIRFGQGREAVEEFYRLNLETRRKHGVPSQPRKFFENLWDTMRPEGNIDIVLADYQGSAVAGLILLTHKDTVTYAYGASDQSYLSVAPNHALFDAAIAWAGSRGYRHFDFGRTSPDNTGLVEFKRQWGTTQVPLPYYHWPKVGGFVSESEHSLKYRAFAGAWRRLPSPIAALIGPAIYRHLA